MRILYSPKEIPEELRPLLIQLADEYSITNVDDQRPNDEEPGEQQIGRRVRFQRFEAGKTSEAIGDGVHYEITASDEEVTVRYDAVSAAARAVGTLLADIHEGASAQAAGRTYAESLQFTSFGVMIDCSRNAVLSVDYLKSYLRRLALMGFSMAMLYTEDTYELPGEEYFGYMRGRYTADEIATVDRYADGLGIEMIGCIQTYAHLEQALRWEAYSAVKDTDQVLLAGEESTYLLIERMIEQVASVYTTRRVHIGMDEAWDMGRGAYLDRNGYRSRFDIFNEHLEAVKDICVKHGLEPMIWSDMYFRIAGDRHDYYDRDVQIPSEVVERIPSGVSLVYWDYYHSSADDYTGMIAKHREMGREPIVASGVWTWGRLSYDHRKTQEAAVPCIKACRKEGVRELFFTMWGDDGAYCDFDSSLAGLAFVSEQAWEGDRKPDDEPVRRFGAVCGGSYEAVLDAGDLEGPVNAGSLLWDDPLLGIYWNQIEAAGETRWAKVLDYYRNLRKRLSSGQDEVRHAHRLCSLLTEKIALRLDLEKWYRKRDLTKLDGLIPRVRQIEHLVEAVGESFRGMWLSRNKPFGLEVLQIRLAGQRERFRELAQRLEELVAGKRDAIPELDEKPAKPLPGLRARYHDIAVGTRIL